MAIVSTKGAYGLTAMLVLAKEEDGEKLLQIKDIALMGDIPQNYLEQILVLLKKAALVESVRGANGGYRLRKPTNEISVFEILNSLECCMIQTDNKSNDNMLEPFWQDTQEKIKEIFSLSLKELEEFLQKNSQNFTYHI
ncbi:MAG: Rrf2 family transcriptional regulator [Sulfurimonas sp.]|nr:Rrf2 family transcriptional regulator [Sulfurimonas sp.]MDD3834912.1 Rrf2 family transcriptional regulator [Sulfurimonas sp.]